MKRNIIHNRKLFPLLVFVVVAIIASVKALLVEEEDDVLVLSARSFDNVIKTHDLILVEFYAPWCGHCKKLAPEYSKAAAKLKKNTPPIPLAKVDATVEKSLATEFGIDGFPTLKVFKNGEMSEYEGGRTEGSIVNYMKKKAGPVAKNLECIEDTKKFVEEAGEVAIIGFFDDIESKSAKIFLKLAAGVEDIQFGITSSGIVKNEYGVSSGTVTVFKTYDQPRTDFLVEENTDIEGFARDVIGATSHLIEVYSDDRATAIFGGLLVHALVLTDANSNEYKAIEAGIRKIAAEMKGEILFVIIPKTASHVYDYFGVKTEDTPVFLVSDMRTERQNKKYFFEGKLTSPDEVKSFITDVLQGKLTPALKSEEPEEDDLTEPVKVVKGKTFKQIVMNNKNDVLLELYAPWCGHCKKLAPIYDELAENLEGIETITIAKIDATANEIDHPKVTNKGFPTIFFFRADAKDNPIQYEGSRDVDGFIKFLKENAVTPVTLDGFQSGKSSVSEEL